MVELEGETPWLGVGMALVDPRQLRIRVGLARKHVMAQVRAVRGERCALDRVFALFCLHLVIRGAVLGAAVGSNDSVNLISSLSILHFLRLE